MLSAVGGVLLFVATGEAVMGVLGNTFIAVVNLTDYAKNKTLSKICFILTGLATSRICLIWIITVDTYTKLFSTHTLSYGTLYEYINYLWVIMNHLSIWFATSLSIIYFLKIANFSHYAFIWLKRRADGIFIFLIGCLFVSLLIDTPQIVKMFNDKKMQYRNVSWFIHLQTKELLINHIIFQFGIVFYFLLSATTCLLLIISLWRHNKQMQSNFSGFQDLNTKAHVKAMKVLIPFIILFTLYFVGLAIEILGFFWHELLFLFGVIIMFMYPCCHSFILILANNQLKRSSLRFLQQLKHCNIGDLRRK
ncbi:taste receptor type 2 member 104-like [Meriones unguiculatus]|uniref:taste receptor type 2 member 104-like n=1 Tax=Meriones unguiculatus TaxID=10047 RepID=UPI000B4E9F41|nr:taste receptor type 2 member 104-like [Meriones unguiculatus]